MLSAPISFGEVNRKADDPGYGHYSSTHTASNQRRLWFTPDKDGME